MYIPRLISWSPLDLTYTRDLAINEDSKIMPSVRLLCYKANEQLNKKNLNVVSKSKFASELSGDPHFYTSLSSYYWPDEKDKSGPWIYKDGDYNNSEIEKYDFLNWELMIKKVVTLSLAWWCTNNNDYAEAAIGQVREWFINQETLMYPNLEYAQTIPNYKKGTPAGIIDINQIDLLLNAIGLLEQSYLWTVNDTLSMRKWCYEIMLWLDTSESGNKEKASSNNHGVYYDKIITSLALYAGELKYAYKILTEFEATRIYSQIDANGKMAHEMSRADAYWYLCWTLSGYLGVAKLGSNIGLDLWKSSSNNLSSIEKAIDWSTAFINKSKNWEYKSPFDIHKHNIFEIFWISSLIYGEKHEIIYNNFLIPLQNSPESHLYNIIYPRDRVTYSFPEIRYSKYFYN